MWSFGFLFIGSKWHIDMDRFIHVAWNDFKLIFRDNSLKVFLLMPILILVVVLLIIPYLTERFNEIRSFVPYILMAASLQASVMFGFIYSIVLINEKDIHVAKIYGVLPISKGKFVALRLIIPFIVSSLITFFLFEFQEFYSISLGHNLLLSMLCGLLAPMMALVVTIISKNKMEGLTWFKIVNLFTMIPIAAFFVPKYTHAFGILPTHWAFQSLNNILIGDFFFITIIIGFLYSLVLIYFFIRRFTKVHFL